MTSAPLANDPADFRDLRVEAGIKFQKIAFCSYAGVMPKVTFLVSFPELAERFTFDRLLSRHDFDIDSNAVAGNRDITESHVKKIAEGIKNTDRPYLGTLTIALPKDQVHIEELKQISDYVSLVMATVRDTAENPVIEDGQHRVKMALELWPRVKDAQDGPEKTVRDYLERTSVEITMLLEGDPDTLSTIFVRLGSTKPISPNLMAVMDKSTLQNRLGLYVTRNSRLLHNRVSYLSTAASKAMAARKGAVFEPLYPAAAVRSAAASIAGVGVRDRTPEQREGILHSIIDARAKKEGLRADAAIESVGREVIALVDYAYDHLPGWRELSKHKLTLSAFKREYVHSSAAGLHVIANVIAAAKMAGVDPRLAIDAMAKLPWERSALRDAKNDRGEPIQIHEMFEGTLAVTAFDLEAGKWRAGTGGATRSTYEPAIERVLRHLPLKDKDLSPIAEHSTFVALGLRSEVKRGRPRKVAA